MRLGRDSSLCPHPSLCRLLGHPGARVQVTVVLLRNGPECRSGGAGTRTHPSEAVKGFREVGRYVGRKRRARYLGVSASFSVRHALGALGRSLGGKRGLLSLQPIWVHVLVLPVTCLGQTASPAGPAPGDQDRGGTSQDSVHVQWEVGAVLCQGELCHHGSVFPRACSAYSRWWCCCGGGDRPGPCPPGKVRPSGRERHVHTRRRSSGHAGAVCGRRTGTQACSRHRRDPGRGGQVAWAPCSLVRDSGPVHPGRPWLRLTPCGQLRVGFSGVCLDGAHTLPLGLELDRRGWLSVTSERRCSKSTAGALPSRGCQVTGNVPRPGLWGPFT